MLSVCRCALDGTGGNGTRCASPQMCRICAVLTADTLAAAHVHTYRESPGTRLPRLSPFPCRQYSPLALMEPHSPLVASPCPTLQRFILPTGRHSCLGHVGALMAVAAAMRRLGEVDPAAFRGNPRCVDHEQQVPPGRCDGCGRWHLKEHSPGFGHLNREVH